MRFKACI